MTLWLATVILLGFYTSWLLYKAVGYVYGGVSSDSESFFLGRRKFGKWKGLLTLFASFVSAGAVLGGVEFYYAHGISTLIHGVLLYWTIAAIVYYIGNIIWTRAKDKTEIKSPIQLILSPFDSIFAEWVAVILTIVFLVPYLSMQLVGMGVLLKTTFGWPYIFSVMVAMLVIYLYTASGGLDGVVTSDVVQIITLLSMLGAAIWYVGANFDSITSFYRSVEAASPQLIEWPPGPGPQGFYTLPMLFSLVLMFSSIALTQAHMAKRLYITRDQKSLSFMSLGFGVMGTLLFLVLGFFGLSGAAIADVTEGGAIIGEVIQDVNILLGAGTLVGIIAATMSTGDSLLLAFGLIFSEQYYKNSPEQSGSVVPLGHAVTLICAIVAVFISVQRPQYILDPLILSAGGTLQLAPAFLAGVFKWKVPSWSLYSSMLTGLIIMLLFQWSLPTYGFHQSVIGLMAAFVVVGAGYVISNG